ncbi:MAG: preprotein translocase subunit SecA, partial [Anaerolineae bacterium]|nr:preprotein translocase subunit SecA [Anaerolineae bacterium]
MLRSLVSKIIGDPNAKEIERLKPIVAQINALEPTYQRMTNEELRAQTDILRGRLQRGETLDDILPDAFALVREAAKRTVGMRHFDVQLMGGIVLHEGKIAEMKTGEGKTLVATLPIYLNALTGKGVHLVTVNDYLARRDAVWMGPIYHLLGLRVGLLQQSNKSYLYEPGYTKSEYKHLRPVPRRQAYAADITYGTNHEFGFDYLRDNLAYSLEEQVQRPLYYAIVDEVDNVFIDEARTPLIISGPSEESDEEYKLFARIAPKLQAGTDYVVDEKARTVYLTEAGLARVEEMAGIDNIYDPVNQRYVHYMEQALKAAVLFREGRDYIIQRGSIVLVDEFTGRLMPDRRLSDGLHQALEAKHNLKIHPRLVTQATITIQNYFRMYPKLAGMTGTAASEAEEFHKIYKLEVVVIPTHKPVIRIDAPDVVYRTRQAKLRAIVREIEEAHKRGQPVLVGTTSVEKSEELSRMLQARGIEHVVLN